MLQDEIAFETWLVFNLNLLLLWLSVQSFATLWWKGDSSNSRVTGLSPRYALASVFLTGNLPSPWKRWSFPIKIKCHSNLLK